MSKNNELAAASSDEKGFFYSSITTDWAKDTGCLGYLRADFAKSGNEFWSSWFDQCPEFKTQAFKDEFDGIINSLRENGILKNRSTMSEYCYKNPQAKIADNRGDNYGFKLTTDNHVYYLRCDTMQGNYNLYCYAYDRSRLEKFLSPPEKQKEGKKPSLTGRLQEKKAEVDARNAERKSAADKKRAPEV